MRRISSVKLEPGEAFVVALTADSTGHLYAATYTTPAKLVKIRQKDMVRVSSIELGPASPAAGEGADNRMSSTGSTDLGLATAAVYGAGVRGDSAEGRWHHVYVGTGTAPGQVVKIKAEGKCAP
jgi:hypothetical protein